LKLKEKQMKIISVTHNGKLAQASATNLTSENVTLFTGIFSTVKEKIENVQILDEVSKDKSPVIRTLVGAALLGPLGALAGAASGISNTTLIRVGITAGSLKVVATMTVKELQKNFPVAVEATMGF
jgi:hypothetical protein